ncbi:ATP:cob(I)alamin adenosyltransferase [Candidatus Kaiserbacteria bacterium]|nr:MAG: ATP:cob(I)alamin adenosyltransferase [Candidatus Kaiserbacteria bacterium]
MALYTGKGDGGTTQLFNSKKGERVSKNAVIFEALGTVDELNTVVGWCRTLVAGTDIREVLLAVQNNLFTIQAELAGADQSIPSAVVKEMEVRIADIEGQIPPITSFLIPGGTEVSSRLDIARAVARRSERRLIAAVEDGVQISEYTLVYANRLSSLLYALVRLENHHNDVEEKPPEYVG